MPANRVRILAGINTSDTMRTYVSKLKVEGLITFDGHTIGSTPAGLAALGSNWERLPEGQALLDHWRLVIGTGGVGDIFGVLLDERKNMGDGEVESDEIARRAGIKSADTLRTYLSKLRVMGLIESTNSGARLVADLRRV